MSGTADAMVATRATCPECGGFAGKALACSVQCYASCGGFSASVNCARCGAQLDITWKGRAIEITVRKSGRFA